MGAAVTHLSLPVMSPMAAPAGASSLSPLTSGLWLAAVAVLTLGTALFVAAEFSLTALERSQIDGHLAQRSDRRARHVDSAHRTLSRQLSGAQVGITITTLVTGYLAEPALASLIRPGFRSIGLPEQVIGWISLPLALLLASALSMVFGELVPKNLAIARPLGTARMVSGLQRGFTATLSWLIDALNGAANWALRSMGIEPVEELRSARSPQELGSLLRSSAEHGTLDTQTARLMDRSLRLAERTAADLMTPRVQIEWLRETDTVPELVSSAQRSGISRFPIHGGDPDEVRGVVHVKQAFGVDAALRETTTLATLARPALRVPETLDGESLIERLRSSTLQLAVVVDEYDGTAGLVTLEDVIEEIVGDVRDEHDLSEQHPVRPFGRTGWILSGLLRSDEVAEATGFEMPDGEYETLAGFLLDQLGQIPAPGEEVHVGDWRLTVHRMDRNRIDTVALRPEPSRPEPSQEAAR